MRSVLSLPSWKQADHQLTQSDLRLAHLKQQFSFDSNKLSADIVEHQTKLDDTIHERKHQESEWATQRDELNQTLSAARADAEKFEADLDNVEREFDDWQSQDIDTLQKNLQQLPQWQSELDIVSTRYSLLTEKHQDIESAFNKRLAELSDKLALELEGYDQQKTELQEKLSTQKAEEQQTLQQIRNDYQAQAQQVETEYRQQVSDLKVKHAELTSALKNAGFSEFEQSQLDLLDAAIKEASGIEDAARESLRRAQQDYQKALMDRQQANTDLEAARREYQGRQHEVEKVEALLYPGNHSLLEFLRKEKPQWEDSLGKVINPELLKRTDLKPDLAKKGDSLFGINLDLESLDTPEYAESEQVLQEKLQLAQTKLADALEVQNDAEQVLSTASEDVRNKELQQAKRESECRTAEANRKRAQQDKEQVQQEYAQALAERKQQNKKLVSANETEQNKCQAQFAEAVQEVRDQQREAETEHQFHWQQLVGDTEEALSLVEQHIHKARQNAADDRKQSEEWLANELDNRGVDIDEIGTLQKQIKQLKDDIHYTDTNRHKVKDYERWYQTIFTGHKVTWQKGLSKARKLASKTERELNSKDAQYKQQRQQLKEAQTETEHALKLAKEQSNDVANINRALDKVSLPTVDITAEKGGDAVNIAQRISEGQELLQGRERLLGDIKVYVEHFDQLIAAQAGTGLSDTWERSREECAVVNAQGIRSVDHRRLVSHLAQLLNVIVPQKLNGLREQGRIFGADLTQYYNVLEDIDRRIVSQSQRITKEVDQELYLDGVSESSVRIRSRISELEFWPELAAFNKRYKAWMDSGAVELPDDEYAESMRRVLDILGRAALSGGISKLLDIELHLIEGKSELFIRTDRQLNESSSHGMAYLILCKFLLAFTRLLRGKADATIHWPIDELGTLHQTNVKKIFDACQNNNISVVGAFPNPESEVLTLFDNRYLIDKATRKLQVVQPKVSAITERLKNRKQEESQEASA